MLNIDSPIFYYLHLNVVEHEVAPHGGVGALVPDAPLADGARGPGVVGPPGVSHQEHHLQPKRGVLNQFLDLSHLEADSLDELDGEEGTDPVEVLGHEAHHVLGQQVVTRVPQPEVVVLEEELVVPLGHVVEEPDVVLIELTLEQTPEEVSLILSRLQTLFVLGFRVVVKGLKVIECSFIMIEEVSEEG